MVPIWDGFVLEVCWIPPSPSVSASDYLWLPPEAVPTCQIHVAPLRNSLLSVRLLWAVPPAPWVLHLPEPLMPLVLVVSGSCWNALKCKGKQRFNLVGRENCFDILWLKSYYKKFKSLLFLRLKTTSLPSCWVKGVQVPSMAWLIAARVISMWKPLWMDQLLVLHLTLLAWLLWGVFLTP